MHLLKVKRPNTPERSILVRDPDEVKAHVSAYVDLDDLVLARVGRAVKACFEKGRNATFCTHAGIIFTLEKK